MKNKKASSSELLLEKYLERIESKLDKIDEDLERLTVENVRQTANIEINTKDLAEHIEGVKQNRKRIEHIEKIEYFFVLSSKIMFFISLCAGIWQVLRLYISFK